MRAAPSSEELELGLRRLAGTPDDALLTDAQVVRRRSNWYTSSFATELVDVATADGERILFCKHGTDYVDELAGLRRGPGYEAEVYAAAAGVLERCAPRWYGAFSGDHGTTVVTEYVGYPRLDETETASAVVEASGRLGALHRRAADLAGEGRALNRYDRDHLERSLERPGRLARDSALREAMEPIEARRSPLVDLLSQAGETLIHGELFAANVLIGESAVFVDWETAGLGAGELDLAALTVGAWTDDVRTACEQAYASARWNGAVPEAHRSILAAARLYVFTVLASHWAHDDTSGEPWLDRQIAQSTRVLDAAL